jgi:hypothetical protein
MNWLALFFALELGIIPQGYLQTYYNETLSNYELSGNGYIMLETEAQLLGFVFIGGNVKTYINKYTANTSFSPVNAEYAVKVGMRFDFIELGFRHYCTHPVVPWLYHRNVSPQWEGAYDEIYLRLEVSN